MKVEQRRRKVSKHGVVTTLGFPEGQMVTVVRVDERTEIITLESPERLQEMVSLLTRPQKERHAALMEALQGRPIDPNGMPRQYTGVEADSEVSVAEADKFSENSAPRRAL